MLRYLGMYPIAILLAIALVTFVTKHHPVAAPQASRAGQPALASSFSPASQAVEPDPSGHYLTPVEIDGRRLTMLVDTGASYVSLTSEDAGELGIRPAPADFTLRMQTANGISTAARTWLPKVQVGSVTIHDVEAIVMSPGASAQSLLGMSFLGKLHRFGVADGRLRLEQ